MFSSTKLGLPNFFAVVVPQGREILRLLLNDLYTTIYILLIKSIATSDARRPELIHSQGIVSISI